MGTWSSAALVFLWSLCLSSCPVSYLLGLLCGWCSFAAMFIRLTLLGKGERGSTVETLRTKRGLSVSRPWIVISPTQQGQAMMAARYDEVRGKEVNLKDTM